LDLENTGGRDLTLALFKPAYTRANHKKAAIAWVHTVKTADSPVSTDGTTAFLNSMICISTNIGHLASSLSLGRQLAVNR
jgi:hypothetical protein